MSKAEYYQQLYQAHQANFPGVKSAWLPKLRELAIEYVVTNDFPAPGGKHWEEWKYTSVKPLLKHDFNLPILQETHEHSRENMLGEDEITFVFIDGKYCPEKSNADQLPEGAKFCSFAELMHSRPECLEKHFGQSIDNHHNVFTALNVAFAAEGACLYIDKNTKVDRVIHIAYVNTESGKNKLVAYRNIIVIDESAEVNIVESYNRTGDEIYFTNAVTEIFAGANSNITHYKLQEESKKAFHIAFTGFKQERDSEVESHSFAFGGKLVRSDTYNALAESSSSCRLYGLYCLVDKQHCDHHTIVDHSQPYCQSKELYKGILADKSRAVFNGKVHVHPKAIQTNAEQVNRNLILSEGTEIDTKPQLEIFNDDVRCVHGATVGKLDMKALFYLRTRGIDKEESENLLTYAFASELIEKVKFPGLREYLKKQLLLRLQTGNVVRSLL